ncbi:MAG: divalent-cation tolerance protein CutA [Gemmatimonadales bacterium]|nr:divalent-cation tolerance protein CutA [Gemmatimonadales bacterium]MDX2056974.1 divalent-cation tolerance protein CutA [Gemmatimonadales bacterium]
MPEPVVQVVTTVDTEEAAMALADRLIAQRLAACVQVDGPIRSRYRWEGRVETAAEWRVVAKTTSSAAPAAVDHLRRHHPYQQPEILTFEATSASPGYAAWVRDETSPPG